MWQLRAASETPDAARRTSLRRRINMLHLKALCVCLALAAGVASAQERRSMSPRGTAATQVGGKWTPETPSEDPRYVGGKWIEFDYGRPIKRGREPLFGSGAAYGKKLLEPAPVWR